MSGRLDSIQVLRAVAALAVTVAHTWVWVVDACIRQGIPNPVPNLSAGAVGVHLFFVISGFIMVYTTKDDPRGAASAVKFFARRLIRIAPLYWMAMLVMAWLWHHLGTNMAQQHENAMTIIYSALFIVHARPDGNMNPMVEQGWTLNYEMFFYLLFAISMLIKNARVSLVGLLGLLLLAGLHGGSWAKFDGNEYPIGHSLLNPMLWEFAFGIAIGLAVVNGWRLPRAAAIAFMLAGLILFVATCVVDVTAVFVRSLFWGVPVALLVAGAASIPAPLSSSIGRIAVLIGAASYSLYLSHGMAMMLMARHWFGAAWLITQISSPWGLVVYFTVVPVLIAIAIHLWIERPLTNRLRRRIDAPPALVLGNA